MFAVQILAILGALCVCHAGNPLPALLVSAWCKPREQSHSTGLNWCGCLCITGVCAVPTWLFVSLVLIDVLSINTEHCMCFGDAVAVTAVGCVMGELLVSTAILSLLFIHWFKMLAAARSWFVSQKRKESVIGPLRNLLVIIAGHQSTSVYSGMKIKFPWVTKNQIFNFFLSSAGVYQGRLLVQAH